LWFLLPAPGSFADSGPGLAQIQVRDLGELFGAGDLLGHEDRRHFYAEVEAGQVRLPLQRLLTNFGLLLRAVPPNGS